MIEQQHAEEREKNVLTIVRQLEQQYEQIKLKYEEASMQQASWKHMLNRINKEKLALESKANET